MADPVETSSALQEMERRATSGQLTPQASAAYEELKRRRGLSLVPPTAQPTAQAENPLRPVGVLATGFNKGLAGWVDLFNDGLKEIGLPMSDTPFMGSSFVDKYLGGAAHQPQNMFESVVHRVGLEAGANVPLLAGALGVQAGARAVKEAGAAKTLAAGTNLEALKQLPAAMAQQLAEISPTKLAALEEGLAAGAGAGAGLVREIFPEGGRTAEFVGELIGSFTPSVALNLVGKARDLVHSGVRAIAGLEIEVETKRRLGETLRPAATPEQVSAGVKRADELRQEVSPGATKDEGLRLSAGEAIKEGAVSDTQIAQEKASVAFRGQARDRRAKNIEEIRNYFSATAPEGNPTRYVERLESERQRSMALLEHGLDRTQAKLDAVRGDIAKRSANLLENMESRMSVADQQIDARLRSLGPQIGKKERGAIIRTEYLAELGKFRERSRTDYAELDSLSHAELPVSSTTQKLVDLQTQFPEQLQAISKINPRLQRAIESLGHDYELIQRATKAQADLDAVGGKGLDQRGGVRLPLETQGTGSTGEIIGLKSNYPYWYKSIANEKVSGTDNVLDRETIEAALDTLKTGTSHGLHDKTLAHVEQAIRADSEFRKSSFYEPVMEDLRQTPSASLKDLRQVRSDVLALSRVAKASDNRVQNYVLQEIVGAVDQDLNLLVPGESAFARHYPEHGAVYQQVSADYRAGVQTLMKGTANALRRVNKYGDYTKEDESIPALFWRNETTMQDFDKAFQTPGQATQALRDYALERFVDDTVTRAPQTGKLTVDPAAAEEWIRQHESQLKRFPDLVATFKDRVRMQGEVDALHEQVSAFQAGKKGEALLLKRLEAERHPGDLSRADVSVAEARLKHAQDVVDRTKQEWQASKTSLFLQEKASVAGARIATAKDPIAAYDEAVKRVRRDPDAVAGLNRAIWEGLTDKLQPRLVGMTGDANLGVLHREIQQWMAGHGHLMERVLGAEGFKRIQTTSEVVERIARGGRDRSDTAINLQVQAALMSTWLSRAFAIASGRVGHVFGVTERVANHLTKTFERMTAKQQDEILLESFFDPRVYQTLVHAGTYGPDHALVRSQLRLHLVNLSGQPDEETK